MKLLAFLLVPFFCFSTELDSQRDKAAPNSLEEQKTFFRENGYLWLKGFFSQEQVSMLQLLADQINKEAQTTLQLSQASGIPLQQIAQNIPGSLIIVPEAKNPLQVCRTEDMLTCYPELHRFIEGTLTFYLGLLLNEPYVLFKDKLNFKWPGGGAFPPHQDFPAYEMFGPREHVTAMVCIDPATLENGCLQVAKNWRETFSKEPALDPEELEAGHAVLPYVLGGKKHGSIQSEYSDKIEWLPLVASPGDVILISSFIPHYSEPNHSNQARRAFFFTNSRLLEGDHRRAYYHTKRQDPDNPLFHFATPTKARNKE